MKRNYLLVYYHKFVDRIEYEYYEKKEDLDKCVESFKKNKDIKILNKYEVKEIK